MPHYSINLSPPPTRHRCNSYSSSNSTISASGTRPVFNRQTSESSYASDASSTVMPPRPNEFDSNCNPERFVPYALAAFLEEILTNIELDHGSKESFRKQLMMNADDDTIQQMKVMLEDRSMKKEEREEWVLQLVCEYARNERIDDEAINGSGIREWEDEGGRGRNRRCDGGSRRYAGSSQTYSSTGYGNHGDIPEPGVFDLNGPCVLNPRGRQDNRCRSYGGRHSNDDGYRRHERYQ